MTTASTRDNLGGLILDERQDRNEPAHSYATGAGHVYLARAMDPGLAYDINEANYTGYLCFQFGHKAMKTITRNNSALCADYRGVPQDRLNYPSIVVSVVLQEHLVARTLTNVHADGLPETYKVAVAMPGLVLVDVEPTELTFSSLGQMESYNIRVTQRPEVTLVKGAVFEGSITWSSSRHTVRSPLLAVVA